MSRQLCIVLTLLLIVFFGYSETNTPGVNYKAESSFDSITQYRHQFLLSRRATNDYQDGYDAATTYLNNYNLFWLRNRSCTGSFCVTIGIYWLLAFLVPPSGEPDECYIPLSMLSGYGASQIYMYISRGDHKDKYLLGKSSDYVRGYLTAFQDNNFYKNQYKATSLGSYIGITGAFCTGIGMTIIHTSIGIFSSD